MIPARVRLSRRCGHRGRNRDKRCAKLSDNLLTPEWCTRQPCMGALRRHEDRDLRVLLHRRSRRTHHIAYHFQSCAACLVHADIAQVFHEQSLRNFDDFVGYAFVYSSRYRNPIPAPIIFQYAQDPPANQLAVFPRCARSTLTQTSHPLSSAAICLSTSPE